MVLCEVSRVVCLSGIVLKRSYMLFVLVFYLCPIYLSPHSHFMSYMPFLTGTLVLPMFYLAFCSFPYVFVFFSVWIVYTFLPLYPSLLNFCFCGVVLFLWVLFVILLDVFVLMPLLRAIFFYYFQFYIFILSVQF